MLFCSFHSRKCFGSHIIFVRQYKLKKSCLPALLLSMFKQEKQRRRNYIMSLLDYVGVWLNWLLLVYAPVIYIRVLPWTPYSISHNCTDRDILTKLKRVGLKDVSSWKRGDIRNHKFVKMEGTHLCLFFLSCPISFHSSSPAPAWLNLPLHFYFHPCL